jgi:hypothetical protein
VFFTCPLDHQTVLALLDSIAILVDEFNLQRDDASVGL